MTITSQPETIKKFLDLNFDFEQLLPRPPGIEDWYNWNTDNYGTKWNRWDYEVDVSGRAGMVVQFTTAWTPPCAFLRTLVETYPETWIKCEWDEEGGMAGVWVGRKEHGYVDVKQLEWEDMCMEKEMFCFGGDNDNDNEEDDKASGISEFSE